MPLGAAFACALLLAGEAGTRAFFKPPYVSLETYLRYYPYSYQYGFDGSRACFRVHDDMSCAKTQDMNIIPQTFPLRKPPGELRIITIGASVSWEGAGNAQSEGNYPSRMLALLEQAHPGQRFRLINLSVPGFGSSRQAVRFREALEYDADLFIVHTHDTNEVRDDQRRAYVRGLHSGLAGKLLYLTSVVVLKRVWSNWLGAPAPAPAVADSTDETAALDTATKREHWRLSVRDNVITMLALAKARSIPVILVGASRSDCSDLCGIQGRAVNGFLAAQVGSAVQFLDVPAVFRAQPVHRRRLFKDRIHYGSEGTRVVAAALAPLVEAALPALRHASP